MARLETVVHSFEPVAIQWIADVCTSTWVAGRGSRRGVGGEREGSGLTGTGSGDNKNARESQRHYFRERPESGS
jgi:hypothetical protein